MPRVPYQTPAFPTTFAQPDAPPAAAPTWGELFDAGFGLENDVKNAYDLMTRPKFPRDPDYPLANKLKDTPFWDEYRDNFIGTQSDEELLWRMDKIREEQKQRETLARGGWAGITAMVAAGVASPVSFIPLAGPAAKGWQLVRQAAGLGALGAAIQEAPLLANQETRTIGETAFSLGASTILSGLLGGAVASLKAGERAALEAGIANPPAGTAISIPQPGGVGAAAVGPAHAGGMDPGPGNLAWALAKGVDSNPVTRSPVIDELNSDWRTAQYTMAQFDDGGVRLIGNTYGVPTTPGGTVSNRVATWYGNFWKGTSAHDEAYAKYYFDNNIPTILPNVRSAVGGITGAGGKISRQQFNKEVAEAFHNGDIHPDANAPYSAAASEAAKAWRKDVYDPILKELQSSGVFKQLDELDEGEQTDKSYLNWVFHHGLIGARPNEFIDFLTKEFNEVYQAEFAKRLEKFQTKDLEARQLIEDIQTPEEQIDEMRDIYGAELRGVEEGAEAEHLTALEDTISELRSRARELGKETGDFKADAANKEYRKQLLRDARDLERSEAERLKPTREKRRALKRRLSNLNKAQVVLEDRVVKKLEKIENSEELSLATLNRAARAGQKALVALSKVSDDKLDEVVERLRNTFAKTADMYDRGEERIVRLTQGEEDFDMLGMAAKQEDKFTQLTQIAERLGQAESIDRAAVRELIDAAMQETLTKIQQITSRRAIRNAKLMEQARAIAPDTLANRIAKITGEARTRRQDFEESLRLKGAADVDLDKGAADFTEQAKADAIAVRHKIQGTYLRLPVVEVAQGERGAVLARNLGFIPTERMKPWLEMDMEKLARTHVRTMAPDLEIAKKFGTIDLGEIIDPMVKEYDARIDALRTATDKKGKPLSQAAQEKRAKELAEELARHKGNVEAVYKRLRHQWGLPTDPDGMGYRLARTVQNLNVLRFMGNVTISSIPDMARPIMRHGLTRVFRDGFVPLVTNFKQFRATADWLRYAGVGTDVVLNTRIAQMNDILDDLQRGSKFERGVEWMTNRMGIVALFNYWTDTMKQFTGVVAHARLMDSIASVMEGKGNVRAATQYLAEVGIGGKEAAEIWEHARATGGVSKVNGVWLPDTELWDAASPAARNYAAAIAREVNNNIVTPGVERPLWTNRTVTGSMIAQFKSFAFSSTQKTLLAGLQQRDANFAVGSAISLALGALSYYIYASATGGETKEKMLNADVDKWADEAIDRSGMLAVFGPGRDLLSRIPTTAPYATFSGGRTTRRGGDNLMDALLGPSFDFATTAAEVVTGMDDPTQSTFHSFRKLMPYQNTTGPLPHLFQLRSIYDTIEEANPLDLPETRR